MFRLPRTFNDEWPWNREINPHHEEVKIATHTWISTFRGFDKRLQQQGIILIFSLLASLTFPNLSKEHLRTASDMMTVFLIFDEYTDHVDASLARESANIVVDALRNPNMPRPVGEILLGAVTQQFWARAVKTASVTSQYRFVQMASNYVEATVQEVHDRQNKNIRSIDDFFTLRRECSGIHTCFPMIQLAFDLPDEVFFDSVVVELSRLAADMVILDNDLYSYNKEQAAAEIPCNTITVLMHHDNCSVEQAMEKAAEMHRACSTRFFQRWNDLPLWDPAIDLNVRKYIEGLAHWATGNYHWSFEIGRYFGSGGKDVHENQMVTWLPKYNPGAGKLEDMN
ncbi:terpenoid synthase [Hysterangium stoloniferum]|nr:terpenoid synthase [Hysterangium stoloniferum]